MSYKILNKTKSIVIVKNAKIADTFFKRLLGFMFRKKIGEEEALIFYNASSIHMCFMFFLLDIVFLDKDMRVIKVYPNLKPWRFAFCFKASIVIELPPGKISKTNLEIGDVLNII
ncbi:MAG: DUF192 domain-containing protein [Candidatus Aenigmatarchaeota archaeon]